MDIGLVRPDQHDSLVELLVELFEFYNAPATADPVAVRAHLETDLVAGDDPIGLVVAAADDGAVIGLAAIEIQHSLVEPSPESGRQLFMKELYVRGSGRSEGVGRALMEWVARFAVDRGCCRIDWTVHRDNARGIAFYEALGARRVEIRRNLRLEGQALADLAATAPPAVAGRRPDLILLNGPPAIGKSTLGAALVAARPGAMLVDLDVLRGEVERWADDPIAAGRAARRRALVMLGDQFVAGHDVVVPQLLIRDEFLLELERTAHGHGARFVEIGLVISRDDALAAFERRSADPETAVHHDAAMLVERNGGRAELERLYDAYVELLSGRPDAIRVGVTIGDVVGTLARIESAVGRGPDTMEA